MLYHRDEQTGDHLVTHAGVERRYDSRAAALTAARELMSEAQATTDDSAANRSAR